MFDFSQMPFFDNHTHRVDTRNKEITPVEFGIAFMHGWGTLNPSGALMDNYTPDMDPAIMTLGTVKVAINLLAKKFNCHADADTVIAERNKRTIVDGYGYAKELYEEANCVGEVADDPAPFGDPALKGYYPLEKLYRLYQMDPCVWNLLETSSSYEEMKDAFDKNIRARIAEGFIGIKSHVFEVRGQEFYPIEDAQASAEFEAAKNGDENAKEDIYLAMFQHVLLLTQELDFPVHIHTGCTGNPRDFKNNTDPRVLSPIMKDVRFFKSHIVFLHGNYPDVRHAALMAHCYPNVWVDLGWMTPWVSLNLEQVYEETLAIAPHCKIMLGTGQHNHAEMLWVSAYVAKNALAHVMQKFVDRGLLSEEQAIETAEQVLYKNAFTLYKIK